MSITLNNSKGYKSTKKSALSNRKAAERRLKSAGTEGCSDRVSLLESLGRVLFNAADDVAGAERNLNEAVREWHQEEFGVPQAWKWSPDSRKPKSRFAIFSPLGSVEAAAPNAMVWR